MTNLNETMVVITNARLSYVNLLKPRAATPEQEPKYSTTILLPKSDLQTKQRLDVAIQAATQKGVAEKWNGVMPPVVATPIHDGDGVKQDGTPFGDECKGHWVFTASASTDSPVEIVDRNAMPIMNQSEIYSGIYANVVINVFPYMHTGRKGVGFGLGPVQKVRDGEVLGGGMVKASSVFSALGGSTNVAQSNTVTAPNQHVIPNNQVVNQHVATPQQPMFDPITGQRIQ